MKKIFIISFPFDERDTGDYDYCTAIEAAINASEGNYKAKYVTSEDIDKYDTHTAQELLSIIKGKNSGGKVFYNSLYRFYENDVRITLAASVIQYIKNNKSADGTIVNIQLRPPETGFLFSPEDLRQLKDDGFKVCITCHEYELNYDRQWLQSIMHPYFQIADSVLFFNEKDQISASGHADHSIFAEKILSELTEIPDSIQQARLLKLSAQNTLSSVSCSFLDNAIIPSVYVLEKEMTDLDCKMLIGEINFANGEPVRYSVAGNITKARPPITLEWGVRENISVHTAVSFSVSGIIIYPKNVSVFTTKANIIEPKFTFGHDTYKLAEKSGLTRVLPTTAEISSNFQEFLDKAPNIVIFGLIRENKGFEDAISIIREIGDKYKKELPNTRLLVVGKASSCDLLAEILKKKFGLDKLKSIEYLSKLLQDIVKSDRFDEKIILDISDFIKKAEEFRINQIKQILYKTGVYQNGDEESFVQRIKDKATKDLVTLDKPSLLQQFINLLTVIPEILPIDIYLDVSRDELQAIFTKTKYAIKYDEKGWANNASGLINLLAYGTVLYTGWGMCTNTEVVNGNYSQSMVLPKGQYSLKSGEILSPYEEIRGQREHYDNSAKKRTVHDKKLLVKAEDIIKDIIAREARQYANKPAESKEEKKGDEDTLVSTSAVLLQNDVLMSEADNSFTFKQTLKLLSEQFAPSIIASGLVNHFDGFFVMGDSPDYDTMGCWGVD